MQMVIGLLSVNVKQTVISEYHNIMVKAGSLHRVYPEG